MKKKSVKMRIINPNCAGIDVGSRSHLVAIGQQADQVQEFGVYAINLEELSGWLLQNSITSVAMESTGNYWQNLYIELVSKGIKVVLANGKFTKSMNRKKTDVLDCQWLQQLHTYGLLSGAFRPKVQICQLRAYNRHREMLVEQSAKHVLHMQKALSQMNVQLHNVLSDVTGKTGLQIIRAIVAGEHDPKELAKYRDGRCKNSQEVIEKSLQGNYRQEHLFALKQAVELYDFYLSKYPDFSGCEPIDISQGKQSQNVIILPFMISIATLCYCRRRKHD